MRLKPLAVPFALALLLGGTAAAAAATAYASTTVNVRSGGGTGYPVVDVLRGGERVEVDYCQGAWCFVEKPGPDGWVNANYLAADRYEDDEEYYDDDFDDYGDYEDDDGFYLRPRSRVQIFRYRTEVCRGGSNFSFCITN